MIVATAQSKQNHAYFSEDWLDLRLVSAMRLMLAASALWIVYLDPTKTTRYIELTYVTLALYTFYSACFYILSFKWATRIPAAIMPWIDVLWFLLLVGLTTGTSSVFFSFIFFPILVASFGWGYSTGLYLTLVSAILFTLEGLVGAQPPFDLTRVMLRPIQLLILGYLISRWGGFRVNLRNRLQLLKELTVLSNPRFGLDRTVNSILESLRNFYDAEACLLLIPSKSGKSYQLYRKQRGSFPRNSSSEISSEAASLFLSTSGRAVLQHRGGKRDLTFDIHTRELSTLEPATVDRVGGALETANYLSVPLAIRDHAQGRLFVVGTQRRFSKSELEFVLQLTDHLLPLIENIRLVDNLASEAAEEERRRIGHDIHDSVIQPYLGLQLGIAAVAQKVKGEHPDVLPSLQELLELTNQELVDLRRYVRELRDGGERHGALLPAINRFVTRFSSVTGIKVEVKTHGKVEVSDRLAAELFQVVAEGLSNVRRHAACNDACVEIGCDDGNVVLEIKNRRYAETGKFKSSLASRREPSVFTPHSIADRVALLGGTTKVLTDENNYTVVSVSVPV